MLQIRLQPLARAVGKCLPNRAALQSTTGIAHINVMVRLPSSLSGEKSDFIYMDEYSTFKVCDRVWNPFGGWSRWEWG
jgi:hypothetical protein